MGGVYMYVYYVVRHSPSSIQRARERGRQAWLAPFADDTSFLLVCAPGRDTAREERVSGEPSPPYLSINAGLGGPSLTRVNYKGKDELHI